MSCHLFPSLLQPNRPASPCQTIRQQFFNQCPVILLHHTALPTPAVLFFKCLKFVLSCSQFLIKQLRVRGFGCSHAF